MLKYVLSRIGAMLLSLFIVMSLSFWIVRLMPMDIFDDPDVPLEIQEAMEDNYHLNEPIFVQYIYYLKAIVSRFYFGVSLKLFPGKEVWPVIIDRLPPTIMINFLSLLISIPLGLIFGTIAALKRQTWIDNLISFFVVIFISVPNFVFASVLQYTLSFKIPIFPTLYDPKAETFLQILPSIALPIIALALNPIATITRYLRGELIENINSEYLLLARTKGLTVPQSIWRHAFRNSLIPITNTIVALLTGVLGGSLVVEKMFAVPGIGGMVTNSVLQGDHFLTVACMMFYAAISLITVLLADLAYGVIDPRVKVGGKKQ